MQTVYINVKRASIKDVVTTDVCLRDNCKPPDMVVREIIGGIGHLA